MREAENPATQALLEWLTEMLAQRLAEALELMTGESSQVAWSAVGELAQVALWWAQPLSLGQDVALWIGAPEASWGRIGSHVLSAAGIEPSDKADVRNTYLEILGQALSGLARDLSGRMHREVGCEQGSEASPPPQASTSTIELILSGSKTVPLVVAVAPALLEAIERAEQPQPSEPPALQAPPEATVEPTQPAPPPAEPCGGRNSKTLELLLEVEMPISISFGRAELPLRDVLKLTTGSIIELNRTVSEPVELIVNNCVIARGEVVVIEGNYGIRIQEIISRQERLRTLK